MFLRGGFLTIGKRGPLPFKKTSPFHGKVPSSSNFRQQKLPGTPPKEIEIDKFQESQEKQK